MKIAVTSQNKLKIDAIMNTYAGVGIAAKVIGCKADSEVGEQPVEEETLQGARNRIFYVNQKARQLGIDRIVSIENGIFKKGDDWCDRAVIVIYSIRTCQEYISYSDEVLFPKEFIEKAREIGFDKCNVGQIMADAGYVADPKDPHLNISGISRQVYIENAARKLVKLAEQLEKRRRNPNAFGKLYSTYYV